MSESDHEDLHEQGYDQGARMAWTLMLQQCLGHLGYPSSGTGADAWILERVLAVHSLRRLCRTFGDNKWPANLAISDILDKHLLPHLEDQRECEPWQHIGLDIGLHDKNGTTLRVGDMVRVVYWHGFTFVGKLTYARMYAAYVVGDDLIYEMDFPRGTTLEKVEDPDAS